MTTAGHPASGIGQQYERHARQPTNRHRKSSSPGAVRRCHLRRRTRPWDRPKIPGTGIWTRIPADRLHREGEDEVAARGSPTFTNDSQVRADRVEPIERVRRQIEAEGARPVLGELPRRAELLLRANDETSCASSWYQARTSSARPDCGTTEGSPVGDESRNIRLDRTFRDLSRVARTGRSCADDQTSRRRMDLMATALNATTQVTRTIKATPGWSRPVLSPVCVMDMFAPTGSYLLVLGIAWVRMRSSIT